MTFNEYCWSHEVEAKSKAVNLPAGGERDKQLKLAMIYQAWSGESR